MKSILAITIFLTFVLINLGGYVHNTGSSLACPDWPLCHGQVMPEMKGGVLIEHSHRLLASLVGFLTILIAFIARKNSRVATAAFMAVAIVALQGILGGITVIYQLPSIISTAHLGLSMIFFCTLIYLHHHTDPITNTQSKTAIKPYLLTVLILIYVQILLGALMRHLGLGGICGVGYENSILCSDKIFPVSWPERIHMLHRSFAVLIGIAAILINYLILKKARYKFMFLPVTAIILITMQIILGIMTIGTGLRPGITMLHLGGAAILLSIFWKQYLNCSQEKYADI